MYKTMYYEYLGLKAIHNEVFDKSALIMLAPRAANKMLVAACNDYIKHKGLHQKFVPSLPEAAEIIKKAVPSFPIAQFDASSIQAIARRPKNVHKYSKTELRRCYDGVNSFLHWMVHNPDAREYFEGMQMNILGSVQCSPEEACSRLGIENIVTEGYV